MNGDWVIGFVIDTRANAEQREALRKIFTGEAGGMFGEFVPLIARIVGVEYLPIEWRRGGRTWGLKVGTTTETKAGPYKGAMTPRGQVVQVLNAPIAEGGAGLPITMGHTSLSKIRLFHFEFDLTGRNSKFGPVDLAGP